tara:strand:- start:5279 stop:5827 length:549 start_codon:yes stop_codon:yes gene_type:complete
MTISVDIQMDPRVRLKARRTLDGKIMIFDHEDIDIILSPSDKKCISFPKDQLTDKVYEAQDRMFNFLSRAGVIDKATIRGGNIHGSLEASILESSIKGIDETQAFIYSLDRYLNDEKPYFTSSKKLQDDYLDSLLKPDAEDSTELGDVPHSDKKGSHGFTRGPYGFMYNYSLVREHNAKEKE